MTIDDEAMQSIHNSHNNQIRTSQEENLYVSLGAKQKSYKNTFLATTIVNKALFPFNCFFFGHVLEGKGVYFFMVAL